MVLAACGGEKEHSLFAEEAPGLITLGWWEDAVDIMIDREMVCALSELADEYDVSFWEQVYGS